VLLKLFVTADLSLYPKPCHCT